MSHILLIGIAGGTGSGKTVFSQKIASRYDPQQVTVVALDSYYHNLDHLLRAARNRRNFDHPDSFDWQLIRQHTAMFRKGQSVQLPVYDFHTHTRRNKQRIISDYAVVIIEGILVLWESELRSMLDIKVFMDVAADIRMIRRLQRDISERGRTMDSVINQYLETVRPMHNQFVEPSKNYADILVHDGGYNVVAGDLLHSKINSWLQSDPP